MIFEHSIQNQITRLFLGFTIVLSLIYSLLILGYSWVVEDNIFNRIVDDESNYIVEHYQETNEIPQPRSAFVSLYNSWQELPGDIFRLHQLDPKRIEFESVQGGSLHVKSMVLGNDTLILVADVSKFEVGKDYLPYISSWLMVVVLLINGIALVVSFVMSKRVVKPLKRLTQKVSGSKSTTISQTFSDEFPSNEVGFLAKTIEENILHIQTVLHREADFTRDVSHELRTPITVLRNIETKAKKNPELASSDLIKFGDAVSQLQLTVTTLLALAREESSEIEELSFIAALESCIINHYELSQNENFDLKIDIPIGFKVKANKNLLNILLNNLLTNAVNYSSENNLCIKTIDNNIYFENKSTSLALSDPFKANVRGDNSVGIGLGLNLVQRLCDSFGWKVELKTDNNAFCIIIST